jgi:hypothetical protein
MTNREKYEDVRYVAATACQYKQWSPLRCDLGTDWWLLALGFLRGMLLKTSRKNFILKTEAIYSTECRYKGTNYTISHFKTQ